MCISWDFQPNIHTWLLSLVTFWDIDTYIYIYIWNTLPKFFTFLLGHPIYIYIYVCVCVCVCNILLSSYAFVRFIFILNHSYMVMDYLKLRQSHFPRNSALSCKLLTLFLALSLLHIKVTLFSYVATGHIINI
jgi:hypothetical protein